MLALVAGIVLAPGKRTVAPPACHGPWRGPRFRLYHYVLNGRDGIVAPSPMLLTMILDRFLPTGPVVIGIDDTIERRPQDRCAASSRRSFLAWPFRQQRLAWLRRWPCPFPDSAALALPFLLSRFLVGTAFSALLSVFYMHTVKPTAISRPFTIGVASTVAALGLALPLVQALFDNAVIIDRGLIPFVNNPAASAVNWIFSSVETFPPLPADAKFTDPPGNVWDEQEDAWDGVWTRRPGTNVFDAVWTGANRNSLGFF